MHMGNVSSARFGRSHFKEALMALNEATIGGHIVPKHLQQ